MARWREVPLGQKLDPRVSGRGPLGGGGRGPWLAQLDPWGEWLFLLRGIVDSTPECGGGCVARRWRSDGV